VVYLERFSETSLAPGIAGRNVRPGGVEEQVREIAAELLLGRIAKPDSLLQKVVLQPQLIVRQSCGTLG
jgi:hypothetical protein